VQLRESATQIYTPKLEDTGADPKPASVRSQILSAFAPERTDGYNSPRTATQGPDMMSVGLTAKDISQVSVKS
jgi:hypothetical protein